MKILLPFLLLFSTSDSREAQDLSISISSERPVYAVGEPIHLLLTYKNQGEKSFYVHRGNHFGPGHLEITATRAGCTYELRPADFDAPIEDLRFFLTPMLPHDTLSEPLPPINDPEFNDLLDLPLPGPGTYRFRATFVSDGPLAEGSIMPIWRGRSESPEIVVKLQSPSSKTVQRQRTRLQLCLSQQICDAYDAIEYFRIVRDRRVAGMLRSLLRRDPNNSRVAEALFNQGFPKDAHFLESIANSLNDHQVQEHYSALARQLREVRGECNRGRPLDSRSTHSSEAGRDQPQN